MPPTYNNRYEIFEKDPNFVSNPSTDSDTAISAPLYCGQRNQNSLLRSFPNSPIYSQTYTVTNAKEKFETYSGENLTFSTYRRNFQVDSIPNPRNKQDVDVGFEGKPATPFSPNLASPSDGTTEPSGVTVSVAGVSETKVRDSLNLDNPNSLNPISNTYKAIDIDNNSNNIGQVRRFVLGIGTNKGFNRQR